MSRVQVSSEQTKQALSPTQKRFNQLTKQITRLREQLKEWQDQLPLFQQSWVKASTPLRNQLIAASREWVLALDNALNQKHWTSKERRLLTEMLCQEVGLLLEAFSDDEQLKAIHDKYSDMDFDEEQRQSLEAFKDFAEHMTGIDLGSEEITSEAELLQRMKERAASQREEEETEQLHERFAKKRRKPNAKQLAAEQKREAEVAMTKQSLRDIYRKLASALHPDKEPDPKQRDAKTALMASVNKAYESNDLLALLEAQLQIEQIDMPLATASTERLKLYNKVLAEQADQLQFELRSTQEHFRMQFAVPGWDTLVPSQLDGILAKQLKGFRLELSEYKTNLNRLRDKESMKKWLRMKANRRRSNEFDMDFDFGF